MNDYQAIIQEALAEVSKITEQALAAFEGASPSQDERRGDFEQAIITDEGISEFIARLGAEEFSHQLSLKWERERARAKQEE